MEEHFTSLELSKKLAEADCELKSKYFRVGTDYYANHCWYDNNGKIELTDEPIYNEDYDKEPIVICPAFDIMNDICVKYAQDFFPRLKGAHSNQPRCVQPFLQIPYSILASMQMGDKEEAEKLIWDCCKFNPKNKEANK